MPGLVIAVVKLAGYAISGEGKFLSKSRHYGMLHQLSEQALFFTESTIKVDSGGYAL